MIIRRVVYIGYNQASECDDLNALSLLKYTFSLITEKTFSTALATLEKFDDIGLVVVSLKSVALAERAMVLGLKQRLKNPEITACYLDENTNISQLPSIVPGRLYMLPYNASLFRKFVKQLSECEDPLEHSTGSLRNIAKLYKQID
jgi:hypothetical protein